MPTSNLIENLRGLIVSHRSQDEAAFKRNAEAIIRSLMVQNCPSEAKTLKDALRERKSSSKKSIIGAPSPVFFGGAISPSTIPLAGLIAFDYRKPTTHLVLQQRTQQSLDEIIREHEAQRKLAQAGLPPRNRLLFWGPPGCGKTRAARMLASRLGLPFGVVRLGSLITSFVGETGSNIQRVLDAAESSRMVLLLDEADAIAKTREDENDVGELRRVVNSLLQGLDSFASKESILILASNHTSLFDEAVWRRFDDVVQFPLPQKSERLILLKHLASGFKIKGDLDSVASKLAGVSFADIEKAVYSVARKAVLNGAKAVSTKDIEVAALEWRAKVKAATTKAKSPSQNR